MKYVDSVAQKIKKTLLIFLLTLLLSFISNLLLAFLLHNPGGGGAEVIVVLPIGWAINCLMLLVFIFISVKRIRDSFMGKLTFPLLFALLLGGILVALPIFVFSLTSSFIK